MHCDTVHEQLDALADGELTFWAAWRLRRHLAHCPACAAGFASIQRLTDRARAWQDVTAPATFREKVPLPTAPRPSRVIGRPAFAIAGTAAVVAAIALLTPGQPAHPTITFADVQRAMQQVNVLEYAHSEIGYGWVGQVTYRRAGPIYLRRSPLTKASHLKVYNTPTQYQESRTLWNADKYAYYDVTRRTFTVRTAGAGSVPSTASIAEELNFFMDPAHHVLALSPEDDAPSSAPAGPEATTLDGRPAWKFVRRYLPISYVPRDVKGNSDVDIETIWADPKTARVLQVELDQTDKGHTWARVLDTGFRYNETPPAGTFDLKPPPGAHVVRTLFGR